MWKIQLDWLKAWFCLCPETLGRNVNRVTCKIMLSAKRSAQMREYVDVGSAITSSSKETFTTQLPRTIVSVHRTEAQLYRDYSETYNWSLFASHQGKLLEELLPSSVNEKVDWQEPDQLSTCQDAFKWSGSLCWWNPLHQWCSKFFGSWATFVFQKPFAGHKN